MFKDHFSHRSANYERYRPHYPAALFEYLAALAPHRRRAWDCGCGTGQAAAALQTCFKQVIATDASMAQLRRVTPTAGLHCWAAVAERSAIAPASIDLVAVAQALHWFDVGRFYDEVKRVLVPRGIIAVWTYNLLRVTPDVDAVIDELYHNVLGPYWPPERLLVENGYADLPFPFEILPPPALTMSARWRLEQLLGYLRTWSAWRAFASTAGEEPLTPGMAVRLQRVWQGEGGQLRVVRWPLMLRVGRVAA